MEPFSAPEVTKKLQEEVATEPKSPARPMMSPAPVSLPSTSAAGSSTRLKELPALPPPPPTFARPQSIRPRATRHSVCAVPAQSAPPMTHCDECSQPGHTTNLVRCDECSKVYHFKCLEPPLNRNPKKRGYSWHCADCDPTDLDDN